MTSVALGVIVGLVVRIQMYNNRPRCIGGPVLAAGFGAKLHGLDIRLYTALPSDLSAAEHAVIRMLDPYGDLLHQTSLPALLWVGPPVVGISSKPQIIGDPTDWRTPPALLPEHLDVLILANADPSWLVSLLMPRRPRVVAMDVNAQWAPYRAQSINDCMRCAHLITITEQDLHALRRTGIRTHFLGHRGSSAVVIKSGSRGVTVLADGEKCSLPAPDVSAVRCKRPFGDEFRPRIGPSRCKALTTLGTQ